MLSNGQYLKRVYETDGHTHFKSNLKETFWQWRYRRLQVAGNDKLGSQITWGRSGLRLVLVAAMVAIDRRLGYDVLHSRKGNVPTSVAIGRDQRLKTIRFWEFDTNCNSPVTTTPYPPLWPTINYQHEKLPKAV